VSEPDHANRRIRILYRAPILPLHVTLPGPPGLAGSSSVEGSPRRLHHRGRRRSRTSLRRQGHPPRLPLRQAITSLARVDLDVPARDLDGVALLAEGEENLGLGRAIRHDDEVLIHERGVTLAAASGLPPVHCPTSWPRKSPPVGTQRGFPGTGRRTARSRSSGESGTRGGDYPPVASGCLRTSSRRRSPWRARDAAHGEPVGARCSTTAAGNRAVPEVSPDRSWFCSLTASFTCP